MDYDENLAQELEDAGFIDIDIEKLDKESILDKNIFNKLFSMNDPR